MKNNPFVINASPDERLAYWKQLRKTIAEKSQDGSEQAEDEALAILADYWSMVPISNFSYNPEDPDRWLTPWEMIHKGDWCQLMVAVGMEMTLRLSGWSSERMEIISFRDYALSEEKMVLRIDGNKTLNYTIGEVVEWPESEKIFTGMWRYDGRKYISAA